MEFGDVSSFFLLDKNKNMQQLITKEQRPFYPIYHKRLNSEGSAHPRDHTAIYKKEYRQLTVLL